MISHAKISSHRRMFKTLTGLSTEGFKQILPSFEEVWEADLDRRDAGGLRLRGRGGGRKGGPRVRRQTRVHPGLFPALPHPSGAGSALRDEPAAGQRVGSPSDPVPQCSVWPPAATPSPPAPRPRGGAGRMRGTRVHHRRSGAPIQRPKNPDTSATATCSRSSVPSRRATSSCSSPIVLQWQPAHPCFHPTQPWK